MNRVTTRIATAVVALTLGAIAFSHSHGDVLRIAVPFDRVSMDVPSSAGQSVADACSKAIAMDPYVQPYDWPEARATLRLDQEASSTEVTVHLSRVRPHTRFSAWLRRQGAAASASRSGDVPLAPRSGAAALLGRELRAGIEATRSGDGNPELGNDFWSDANGDATLRTRLAFPLVDGIGGADEATRFTVRIASNCADLPGRAAASGSGQPWFDWHFAP